MKTPRRWILVTGLLLVVPASVGGATEPSGERLYRLHCAPCHGPTGRGDGPDATLFASLPRDLREGFLNKYPTPDLVRRIRDGAALQLGVDLPALQGRATSFLLAADVTRPLSFLCRLLRRQEWSSSPAT